MRLKSGRYRFGSDTGALHLRTAREGFGSAAGHDLLIAVTQWGGVADVDVDDPHATRAEATFDSRSLAVVSGTGGVRPLTDRDRCEIVRIAQTKVLDSARFPSIHYAAPTIDVDGDLLVLSGDLTICGRAHPVDVTLRRSTSDERVTGTATVVQTRWAITPYRGLLGALKVADAVQVAFDVTLVPA